MNVIAEPRIAGAAITPLDHDCAAKWLAWLIGAGPAPADVQGVRFALAHCDSGVTWAFLDDHGVWNLGSAVDAELCPVPSANSLHELRLFGITAEVLIWRADFAGLRGRILADDLAGVGRSHSLYPMDERRQLRGKCRETLGQFKRYVDEGGAQHLPPASFPGEFHVRHYFEQDVESGAVRIAATRLVPEKLA